MADMKKVYHDLIIINLYKKEKQDKIIHGHEPNLLLGPSEPVLAVNKR